MKSDLEIARETKLRPIGEIAAKLHIPDEALEQYGRHKAGYRRRSFFSHSPKF